MGNNSKFIHDNFLLENKFAEELYHGYAAKMPIIDYHNHLSPQQLAADMNFESITQAWLQGDHYKYRASRALGINEKYITGNATDLEKFEKWAYAVPFTMRNPLYHWTHMELSIYFGINELLTPKNAKAIYEHTSNQLKTPEYSCQKLISRMNVEVLCTTEDPTDTLEHHQKLLNSDFTTKVSTAFRPDKAIMINADSYNDYLDLLGLASDTSISTYEDLCTALEQRIGHFHENGCRLSDHGLPHLFAEDFTQAEVTSIFNKRRAGNELTEMEASKFQSALLLFCAELYHDLGWVQQFHLGAMRNNNSRMYSLMGPDTGWDSIGDYAQAENLSKFLNVLDSNDKLAKTILYNVNPTDNEVLATMIGNFNDGSIKGKLQWGSGWWFLDQKDGMIDQMNVLSNMGLISCFIGMLTDSRSFLSFPRHEYFRRILCNLFGTDIQNGTLPHDMEWIGKIIEDVCYTNAKEYFNF